MHIYLIRHGADDPSYRGGWSKLSLTNEGIEQSKKLAEYLKNKQNEYKIQKIISSDLKRATQTADIINEALNLPIEYTEKLREMNNGELAGMLNEEAEKRYPGVYYSTLDFDEKYPNGESPKEFYSRIEKSFKEIINENQKLDSIMLVTHGGVINIIYHIIKEKEWNNKQKSFQTSTASIHRVAINEKNKIIDIENFKEHLR